MTVWDWLLGRPTTLEATVDANPDLFQVVVPAEVFGVEVTTGDATSPVGKITRATARQVPAVKRARDLICGTLGGIPLNLVDPTNKVTRSQLLEQPETDVPRSVTFARLFEDLLYDRVAWWEKTQIVQGFPVKVKRLDPCDVRIVDGKVWVKNVEMPDAARRLIRFDSPNGGLLEDGARAIRTLLKLEAAAANYADDPMPQGYFAPVDGADPMEDAEIVSLLTSWKAARKKGATGYVPAALKYNDVQFSPKDLQMADARQHAVLEIARLTGIDAEDLSVSTTSRTYLNGQQKRQERINDVLGPFMQAVTDRLRMGDITPAGYEIRPDYNGYLQADDATRLANYQLGLDIGLYSLPQVAQREGLPAPAAAGEAAALTPRELAELVQKIYLGVGSPDKPGVLTREEARAILNRAGAGLTAETRPALTAVRDTA